MNNRNWREYKKLQAIRFQLLFVLVLVAPHLDKIVAALLAVPVFLVAIYNDRKGAPHE